MTCPHNHDQIPSISAKNIFERFSDLPKLSLCFNLRRKSKKFSNITVKNLMKIGWKIRRLWHFEVSQIFQETFLDQFDMNMQMSEVMMSSPHNFPFILYTEMSKISYFSYENVRLALNSSLNRCRIMLTPIYLDMRDILSQVWAKYKKI